MAGRGGESYRSHCTSRCKRLWYMNLRVETLGILQSEFECSRMLRPKHTPEMLNSELLQVYRRGSATGTWPRMGKAFAKDGRQSKFLELCHFGEVELPYLHRWHHHVK